MSKKTLLNQANYPPPPLFSLSDTPTNPLLTTNTGRNIDEDDHDQHMSKDDDHTDDEGGVLLNEENVGEPLSMGRTVNMEVRSGVNATTYKWKRVASIPKDERAGEPRFDLQATPPPPPTLHYDPPSFSFVSPPQLLLFSRSATATLTPPPGKLIYFGCACHCLATSCSALFVITLVSVRMCLCFHSLYLSIISPDYSFS